MPQSTVEDSILSTLGSIAGISGRRAQDGLTAQQAQSYALKNEADRRALQDDEDARTFGELDAAGYITIDPSTGTATIDGVRLANENPELLARFIGPEANRFLSTRTDKGNQPVTFAGVKKLPGEITQGPNPLDAQTGPISLLGPQPAQTQSKAPDQYVVQLRTQDGRTVPATQNASAAADDTLITLDEAGLNKTLQGRLNRMYASGALDNNVTMTKLNLGFQKASDDYLQAKLAEAGGGEISDDPAAARGFYGILNDLTGEDLNQAVRDSGLDPDALRAEALDRWTKKQQEERKRIPLNTEDMTHYESTKTLLQNQVDRANKALEDFDKMPKPPSGRTGLKATGSVSGRYEKYEKQHTALVKERDAAQAALSKLKPPEMKPALESGAPMPKFEWTEDNLRDAVRGKIGEQPTQEQTAALTKYAKDNGVATAQDLSKLPRNDALALAWVIASNTRATPEQRVGIFDKLANYARTGDTARSPIEASIDVSNATVNQANARTAAVQAQSLADNRNIQNAIDIEKLNIDWAKLEDAKTERALQYSKDIDSAGTKVAENMDRIYKGTIGEDRKFLKTGPTADAMAAWKTFDRDMMNSPQGSPKQVATSKAYLEGFFQMAAASAMQPGAVDPTWDWAKLIANTFFREEGMVNMSPLIETAKIEYTNGKPTRVSFTDHGDTGKETEVVVGADEFKRFTGASSFNTFVNAVHSQQAANLLQAEGKAQTPENIVLAVKAIRQAAGMDKE